MKAALQLKQGQQLSLTPQLQQSLRLLQMSSLELAEEIERIVQENPLLEKLDADDGVVINGEGHLEDHYQEQPVSTDSVQNVTELSEGGDDSSVEVSMNDDLHMEDFSWDGHGQTNFEDEDQDHTLTIANPTSLREHLYQQLAGRQLSQTDRVLVELWIDTLDERGFITLSDDEFLALLPSELALELDDVLIAKRLLQSFDPVGVGAYTLQESLLLQLKTLVLAPTLYELVRQIIEHHLELCAEKNYKKLMKLLACDEDALRTAMHVLQRLDPYPAREFSGQLADFVIPDIVVEKKRHQWVARLNAKALPHVKLNEVYAELLNTQKKQQSKEALAPLQQQLQEAKFFLRSIEQRYLTILRVAEFIVQHQKHFFSQGAQAMKPLVAREVAEALDLHESTVSRVTQHKYMQTPHGFFELKYFFSSQVATDAGGNASSTAIKAILQQLIQSESASKPLSDQKLVELLEAQGLIVARRTVAKYREQLGFPAANLRKHL